MNTNEMTDLETHLRSWVPRPPSKTLSQRLFGASSPAPKARAVPSASRACAPRFHFSLSWLTPAAAALGLLVLAFIHQSHPALSTNRTAPPMLALAWSNQAAMASLSAVSSNEQFTAPAESLASTNLRSLTSSVSPRSLTSSTN